jgi:hypothetical protein
MKIQILLTPDGHQCVAKGDRPYSWDFHSRPEDLDGGFSAKGYENYSVIAEVEVALPSSEQAVLIALAQLKKKEQDIQAQAFKDLEEVKEARANLLSLTYSQSTEA